MEAKRFALIVAGGSGTRMGASVPKQFLLLAGKPILQHTVARFYSHVNEIWLVLPEQHIPRWNELCLEHQFTVPHTVVAGGSTRFDSVKNGLSQIHDSGFVAVHDGVRPLISTECIGNTFRQAALLGNAICAVRPKDSVRFFNTPANSVSLNREACRLVQTPQIFDLQTLMNAYTTMAYHEGFTDDASVAEAYGVQVHMCEGEYSNIKITTPEDLAVAEALLQRVK
jgi:2-C-methyl-D-erythritol 4-phosphate cytidylyltransferase